MKRALKIIAVIFALMMILIALALFIFARTFNPNVYKPQIVALVSDATGRNLALNGDLSWSFWPDLAIHVDQASLSNPLNYTQPVFAQVKGVDISVALWPLLHGRLVINRIYLEDPQLFLVERRHDNNWTFTPAKTAKLSAGTSAAGTNKSFDVKIEKFSVADGEVSYDNLNSKSHYYFNHLNMKASGIGSGNALPVNLSGDYTFDDMASGHFELNAQYADNDTHTLYHFDKLTFDAKTAYISADNTHFDIHSNLAGNMVYDRLHNLLTLSLDALQVNDVPMKGTLKADLNTFNYSGMLVSQPFNLAKFLQSFKIKLPAFPRARFDAVAFNTQFAGNRNNITLSNLEVRANGSTLDGSMKVRSFDKPAIAASFKIDALNIADYFDLQGAGLIIHHFASNINIYLTTLDSVYFPTSLFGKIHFNANDVTLTGLDLGQLMADLNTRINQLSKTSNIVQDIQIILPTLPLAENKLKPNPQGHLTTALGVLNGDALIKKGVVTLSNTALRGPLFLIEGKGMVNLPDSRLELKLDIKPIALKTLASLIIPYEIRGSFSDLNQGVNWPIVTAELTSLLVSQVKDHLVNNVKQNLLNLLNRR